MNGSPLPIILCLLPLAVVLAVSIYLFLDVDFSVFSRSGRAISRTVKPPRESAPVIAYKKGILLPGPSHFTGVMGGHYSADSVKNLHSAGFHAYESFDRALSHEQEGNVLLEVLLSGDVERMEQGYVAERQRVLQIIPYLCDYPKCPLLPSHFGHEQNDTLVFACPVHAILLKAEHKSSRLYNAIPFVKPVTPFVVETIDRLPWRFPWMLEHKIVVGRLRGRGRFVPTKLTEKAVSK